MRTHVHDLLAQAAHRHGDAAALTFGDSTLTYAQLWDLTTRVAAGLVRAGLSRDDRVAVYADKSLETVAAMFGVSAAGGVIVPVNPLLKPRQVMHILTDCATRMVVTSPERFALLREELTSSAAVETVILTGPGQPEAAGNRPALLPWEELVEPHTRWEPPDPSVDQDMAAIFYTSGSTGRPKGVVVSHRNLMVGAQSVAHYLANTSSDVILAALPLSFDAGFSQLTTGFHAGAQVVLVNFLLPRDVVRVCAQHRVTGITGVPPLWTRLAEQSWPAEAAGQVRYFANTGGRMPKTLLDKLRAIFPVASPYLMYGLTEAFRSTYLDPAYVDQRPDSIGKAIPNTEILVVRPDGTSCDPGEPGELVHRGPLVAMGYWNDPVRTAERFRPAPERNPNLCTTELAVWSGDTVMRDEEGFLYFVGREDEMMKTSGYRVSPTEVEEVAFGTGLIRDAVALGLEDPQLGQHIVLVVTAAAGVELDSGALHQLLRRQLPLYMVPKRIVVADEIPRSPNGKYDRAGVRESVAQ